MIFKAQLAADLTATFLREDEFAGRHVFQGRDLTAVVAKDSAAALDEWRKRTQEPPGVIVKLQSVYCASGDIDPLYPEDVVTCDSIEWSVLATAEDDGLLTVHLYRHES